MHSRTRPPSTSTPRRVSSMNSSTARWVKRPRSSAPETPAAGRAPRAQRSPITAWAMSEEFSARPPEETSIGEYAIVRLLGEGAMGQVFQATAPDGEWVALKLLKAEIAGDETLRRRFQREARIAQTVRHPNVVPLIATGEHEGRPYMVQSFIDGLALEQKLERDGPLGVEAAMGMGADVAAGLEALWAAGMVHRDVKPGNILLEGGGRAYIADFGLSKDTQGSLLTRPGQALGSMDYMAPEQIRGDAVGAATDIYALGCVIYECMC